MADDAARPPSGAPAIEVSLPFAGRWRVENSPARRVPSHGSDLFGERYAIDFVAVDDRRRSAEIRDWRTLLATEPPERFLAFGCPILAPRRGTVVDVHDGEPDHEARRSQLALVPYALSQAERVRQGVAAVAGNYVTVAVPDDDAYVVLTHLQRDSIDVAVGEQVQEGQPIARCGNSGNSTQPHLHLQAMDGPDPATAEGVPMTFRSFREWPRRGKQAQVRVRGVPQEGSVVEPV